MPPQIDAHRNDGIVHAKTRHGLALPVIDVTHPRFAVADDAKSLEAQREAFLKWDRERRRVPKFVTRLMLHFAAKRSPLVRAIFQSDKGFLDSITTYMMKLGEQNLPPGFDGRIDRKIAASPHTVFIRLRMQQIAKLLAEALVAPLGESPGVPLHFINIAGGPALDSINAVILLNRDRPDLLTRSIVIHVLDAQDDGPFFGANALTALKSERGPLHRLNVDFEHQPYDWNETAPLSQLVAELQSRGAILAASSEGGLFEYGGDEAIIANLTALRAGVKLVAGSVTSASDMRKQMIAETRFRIVPRGIEGFAPLAAQAGYRIAKTEPAILSDQVLLQWNATAA